MNHLYFSKIKKDFLDNWIYYSCVLFLLCVGLTSGIVVAKGLMPQTKLQINAYLLGAINFIKENDIEKQKIFINSFLQNMFFFAIITASSFFRIGFIFVLILDFLKGLFLGFTLFFLTDTLKFIPLLILIASILFSFLILIFSFIRISELGIKRSLNKLFKNKKQRFISNDENIKDGYLRNIGGIFLFMLLGILLETFFVPMIIRMF